MPVLVQICVVLSTLALLAMVVMAVRTVSVVLQAAREASELAQAMRLSLARLDSIADETRLLASALRGGFQPMLRVVGRLAEVGHRAASLSSAMLDELEAPIFAAAAVARGVRAGANYFLKR